MCETQSVPLPRLVTLVSSGVGEGHARIDRVYADKLTSSQLWGKSHREIQQRAAVSGNLLSSRHCRRKKVISDDIYTGQCSSWQGNNAVFVRPSKAAPVCDRDFFSSPVFTPQSVSLNFVRTSLHLQLHPPLTSDLSLGFLQMYLYDMNNFPLLPRESLSSAGS